MRFLLSQYLPGITRIESQHLVAVFMKSKNILSFDQSQFSKVGELASQYSLASRISDGDIFKTRKIEFISDPPVLASKAEINSDPAHWLPLGIQLRQAKTYIVAQSPYLIASKRTKGLVRDILEKNPDLQIHFSTNSLAAADHVIVASVSQKRKGSSLISSNTISISSNRILKIWKPSFRASIK
jgi:hypothetical protein